MEVRTKSYGSIQSGDSESSFMTSDIKTADEQNEALLVFNLPEREKTLPKKKLIRNRKELIVIISMVLINLIGQTANSVIAPFFTLEGIKKQLSISMTGLIFTAYPFVVFIVSPIVGKFGISQMFGGIGFMAGPAFGGLLYKYGGFKLPFLVTGLMVLLVIFVGFWVLPAESAYQIASNSYNEPIKTGSLIKSIGVPAITLMAFSTIFGTITVSFFDPTLTAHIEDISNGMSSEKLGLVFLLPAGFFTLSAPFVGSLTDKLIKARHAVIGGLLFMGLMFLFTGPSPLLHSFIPRRLYIVLVALGGYGLGLSFCLVPIMSDMQLSGRMAGLPDTIGTKTVISGIYASCYNIGSVIGPTLGGYLVDKLSFEWASTVIGFTLIGWGLCLCIFTVWERRSAQ